MMQLRIYTACMALCFAGTARGQDGLIGDGFGTNNWVSIDNLTASAGGSMRLTTTANGTGNRYFRLTSGGVQQSPSPGCVFGQDTGINDETEYTAGNNNCTNGAWFYNVVNAADNFVFKTPNAASNRFILFRVQGVVNTITTVNQNPTTVYPGQSVQVSATVSGAAALPAGQGVYLRYTANAWASSAVVEMSHAGGGVYTASIPPAANTPSASVNYYAFTSGDGLSISHANADWYTINLNNNGGPNYSYTVQTAWTTQAGGNGLWSDPNRWDPLAVPPPGVPVIIQDNITLDMDATVASVVIDPGVTFTASDAAPRTLSLLPGGFLSNNGIYQRNLETLHFLGNGSISGTVAANNISISGGLNPNAATAVHGFLTILPGGFLNANSVTYAPGSTLFFNTGAVFDLFAGNLEWNASVTPHHLRVGAGTQLHLRNDLNRQTLGNATVSGAGARLIWDHSNGNSAQLRIGGNLLVENGGEFNVYNGDGDYGHTYYAYVDGDLTVTAGSQFYLNQDIGDDLDIKGHLLNNGIFNSSNRLVVFNGSATQTLTGTFSGPSKFHYIETNNPNGISLFGDMYVEDELRMNNGHIYLNTNNLVLETNALVLGAFGVNNMVVPNGTGFMVKQLPALGGYLFPVGDTTAVDEYSPAAIQLTGGTLGGGALLRVRLADEKHPNNPAPTHYLTRHWTVEQQGISNPVYDMQLQYLDGDIVGTETEIYEIKSSNGGATWLPLGMVDAPTNRILLSAQTAFSIFTGGAVLGADLAAANPSCNGGADGSIDLTLIGGSAPYQFVWSHGFGGQDPTGLTAGGYQVTITDGTGFTFTGSVTLGQPAPIDLTLLGTLPATCSVGGSIDINASGGTPGYTYLWSNGSTAPDPSGLVPGNYAVTLTDTNGCTAVLSSIAVGSDGLPIASLDTALSPLCNGNGNGSIQVSISDGTPGYTYLWSNGATTQDLNAVSAGVYSLTVTDANGCTTVLPPVLLTDPTPLSASVQLTPAACGQDNGAANLTVNGATPPYNFAWSNGASTQNLSGLAGGTYALTLTDANGCLLILNNLVVDFGTAPSLSATVSQPNCALPGSGWVETLAQGGTEPYAYLWSNGATTASLSGLGGGSYTLTLTDAAGCTDTFTVLIDTYLMPALNAVFASGGSDTSVLTGTVLTVSSAPDQSVQGVSYAWTGNAGAVFAAPTAAQTTVSVSQAGAYFFVLTAVSPQGCTAYDTIFAVYQDPPQAENLELPSAFTPNGDGNNDVFRPVGLAGNEVLEFKIYNRWGQLLYDDPASPAWDGSFRGAPQPREVYLFVVSWRDAAGTVQVSRGELSLIR